MSHRLSNHSLKLSNSLQKRPSPLLPKLRLRSVTPRRRHKRMHSRLIPSPRRRRPRIRLLHLVSRLKKVQVVPSALPPKLRPRSVTPRQRHKRMHSRLIPSPRRRRPRIRLLHLVSRLKRVQIVPSALRPSSHPRQNRWRRQNQRRHLELRPKPRVLSMQCRPLPISRSAPRKSRRPLSSLLPRSKKRQTTLPPIRSSVRLTLSRPPILNPRKILLLALGR
jgi:hypothetical protein